MFIEPLKHRHLKQLKAIDRSIFDPHDSWGERGEFAAHLKRHDAHGFVAREGQGKPILGYSIAASPHQGHLSLDGLGVVQHARGKGIGDALFGHQVQWAKDKGYRTVSLEVRSKNTGAQALYRKHGFSPVNTLPKTFYHNDTGVVMQKRLQPKLAEELIDEMLEYGVCSPD